MAKTADPAELALVRRAIELGRTCVGYCEWEGRAGLRGGKTPPLQGLTPEGIKQLLCDFVVEQHGEVIQVREKRREYQDYRFYYKVIVPVAGLARALFIELRLVNDDPEEPAVLIVNAHEQGR